VQLLSKSIQQEMGTIGPQQAQMRTCELPNAASHGISIIGGGGKRPTSCPCWRLREKRASLEEIRDRECNVLLHWNAK
jgi:hypothetical protein